MRSKNNWLKNLKQKPSFVTRILRQITSRAAIVRALSISVTNQVVSSGISFIYGIYLAAHISQIEFGLFSASLAICVLITGIGNSLILLHMTVSISRQEPPNRLKFATKILAILLIALLASIVVAAATLAAISSWFISIKTYIPIFSAICLASSSLLIKDFFLRYSYAQRREEVALYMNLVTGAAIIAVIIAANTGSFLSTGTQAIGIYGIGQALAVVVGFAMIAPPILSITAKEVKLEATNLWKNGKWSLSTNIINWLRTQAASLMALSLAGPIGAATVNATRLLITPATVLLPAAGQILLPRLADIAISDIAKAIKFSIRSGTLLIIAAAIYSGILVFNMDTIVNATLGSKYSDVELPLYSWIAFLGMHIIATLATLTFQAMHKFSQLTLASFGGTLATIASVFPLYQNFGISGIIIGMCAGELIYICILLIRKNSR